MMARLVPVVFVLAAIVTATIAALQQPSPSSAMLASAQTFLQSLTAEQRQAAMFPFTGEDRFDWHYIPRQRKGVALKTMTPSQQNAASALLRSSLSEEGYDKAETIRELEQILFEREGRAIRDRELYFFMVFGEPSASGSWGWRYEGHHISQNWTIVDGRAVASSPQFFGTNPADISEGRMAGTRVLAREEDHARTLLGSLSPQLRTRAIISTEAPGDILTTSDREAAIQDNTGVAYQDLNAQQQSLLWSLVEEYARVQPPAIADARLDKIRGAGLDDIRFAWMGGAERGEGHYYRIQGRTFLIEYDNVQNNANHAHSVWRDFEGDFGLDLLAAHYERFAHRLANADD